jgi:hypothetical protein
MVDLADAFVVHPEILILGIVRKYFLILFVSHFGSNL